MIPKERRHDHVTVWIEGKKEIERLRATLSPEQVELTDLQGALEDACQALAAVTAQREQEVQKLDALRAQLMQTEEELNLQSFGVYKPRYDLMGADEYRARMREEAKLAKEIEEERKKLEKEQRHYQNALHKIDAQLAGASEADRADIEHKREELVQQLQKIDQAFKDVDCREANQRAGYVYIISNVGAFGENVYKIGMTRRLDPMERMDELGDASVPFDFDVHAMIFFDDAPKLEAALHNAFADRKLNFVNQRREFFRVTLDEIKAVMRANFDKTVEFVDSPPPSSTAKVWRWSASAIPKTARHITNWRNHHEKSSCAPDSPCYGTVAGRLHRRAVRPDFFCRSLLSRFRRRVGGRRQCITEQQHRRPGSGRKPL